MDDLRPPIVNPLSLSGRRILVTGASSGIGRETAGLLSRLGARVVLVGRSHERLQQAAALMHGSGHRQEAFDLEQCEEIPAWLRTIVSEFGLLHGLVHSAGITLDVPLRVLRAEQVDRVMRINVGAALALAKGFRQKGICSGGGSLVLLSSVISTAGRAGVSAYAASKGAVAAMTRSLAVEMARDGIRVNCVAPAFVRTEMLDSIKGRLTPEQYREIEAMHLLGTGEPEDVAHAVAFLLADTGRWITGTTLTVDGGYTAH
jgi:NAD(P)-dependent dehydrogenase (short-subunit alcohol dehydrogenase family)